MDEQGVALTGRNTTGPPSLLPLVSYAAYANVTDDDRRRQTPATVTSLLCVGGPVIKHMRRVTDFSQVGQVPSSAFNIVDWVTGGTKTRGATRRFAFKWRKNTYRTEEKLFC